MDSGVGKQSTVFVKREHVLFISTIYFALIKRQECQKCVVVSCTCYLGDETHDRHTNPNDKTKMIKLGDCQVFTDKDLTERL